MEKDQRIIIQAGMLFQTGTEPGPAHVATLLQETRAIAQIFLRKAAVFPIHIRIQYQDIERYRQQRIELLLQTSYDIFSQWQHRSSFRAAVKEVYSKAQFHTRLNDILRLYAMETRMLSRSVRIPYLLTLARDAVTQNITDVMEQQADMPAKSVTHTVYR